MADGVKKVNEWILKPGRVLGITIEDYDPNRLEGGTLYIGPTNGKLQYLNNNNSRKTWSNFDPAVIFNAQSITENLLKDNSISEVKIKDNSITNSKYADNSISTSKYKDRSITSVKLALGSVIGENIAEECIVESKIANNAITENKLADSSISTSKYRPLSITNNAIADGTIENSKIKNKTLTNEKIADATIINSLYCDKSITENKIDDNAINSRTILNGAITHDKIGVNAVYGDNVLQDGIESRHIKSLSGNKIDDNSIGASKLTQDSVTTNAIKNGNVSFLKLDSSVQDLINNSIRVLNSQNVNGQTVFDTAYVNGNLAVKNSRGDTKLTVFGNIEATGDITGARVFNPYFCDLAEAYIPTEPMEKGDAVCLCEEGDLKIEKLNSHNIHRFIGFVSTEYAVILGATPQEIKKGEKVPVALAGRIDIKFPKNKASKIGHFVKINIFGELESSRLRNKSNYIVARVLKDKKVGEETAFCQVFPLM